MKEILKTQLSRLEENYYKISLDLYSNLPEVTKKLSTLKEELQIIENSWQGIWDNETYNIYSDFINDQEDLCCLDYNFICQYIREKTELDSESIFKLVYSSCKKFEKIKETIIVELSILKEIPEFENQAIIYSKIENYEWGYSPNKFVEVRIPKHQITDIYKFQEIASRGYKVPPRIQLEGNILGAMSKCISFEEFEKLIQRLFREINIKLSKNQNFIEEKDSSKSKIINLFERFHIVSKQLINRYSKRNTLEINDEYDVQDLLLALLKIHFDDVRNEEYGPSHAGRRPRMDFLLKKEAAFK